jgi:hypothetical protein
MIYIVTSTTTNVPNLSTGPVMGVHGSLKEANAHMSMCVAAVAGGKLCWDNHSKPDGNSSPPEYRRAMIARPDGGSTVITIQGWDIRRAKRAKKAAVAVEPDAHLEGLIVAGGNLTTV